MGVDPLAPKGGWWGEDGHGAEVRLAIVDRVAPDGDPSSAYVVVYASLSPATFALADARRAALAGSPDALALLDAAQDRGERFGWVAQAFLEELGDDPEKTLRRARKAFEKAKKAAGAINVLVSKG